MAEAGSVLRSTSSPMRSPKTFPVGGRPYEECTSPERLTQAMTLLAFIVQPQKYCRFASIRFSEVSSAGGSIFAEGVVDLWISVARQPCGVLLWLEAAHS